MGRHVAQRSKRPVRSLLIATAAIVFILSAVAAAIPAPSGSPEQPVAADLPLSPVVAPSDASIAFERPSVTTQPAPVVPVVPDDNGLMSLTEFRAKYEGTYQILPGYSTAECMAVFSHYNFQVVGGSGYNAPGAQDVWLSNTWTVYDRIAADQPAQVGDVALWSGSYGAYRGGGYGHVALVLEDRGSSLLTLSQNPTPISQQDLSKYGVLGYLRPHNLKL